MNYESFRINQYNCLLKFSESNLNCMYLRLKLIVVLSIVLSNHTMSQWVQTGGPEGGYTDELIQIGSTLFVSAGNGGVYKSVDDGNSWANVVNGMPSEPSVQTLIEHNGLLYASIYANGIYFSNDLGANWTPINSGIEQLTFSNFVVAADDIYAANANGGIYYSSDHGTTWSEKSTGISNIQFQDLIFFDSKIYAGGSTLYESSNNGDSWEEVEITGLGLNGVRSMTVKGGVFNIADDGSVFTSMGDLSAWTKSTLNTNSSIVSMGVSGDSTYFTTSIGRVYYTKNDWNSWTLIQNSLTSNFVNNVLFLDDRIIMSTSEGMYKSIDDGDSWVANKGVSAVQIESLMFSSSNLFAGSDNQGIFRSADLGESWESINQGLDGLNAYHVSDIVVVDADIFIGTGSDIYASSDNGDTWVSKFYPGINKSTQALGYDDGLFAVGVNGSGVYKSLDNAETWQLTETDVLNTETSYESILVSGDTIIVSTHDAEIFVSKDEGVTWADISIQGDYYFTYSLEYFSDKLYAATSKGLLLSEDLGLNWTFFNNDKSPVHGIIVDNNKIYSATSKGVYVTSDVRDEWYMANDGFGEPYVNEILLKEDKLFVGTFSSSVWVRDKSEMNIPPIITGLSESVTTPEESSIEIVVANLVVDDPDNSFPDDFVLTVKEGENYSVSNNQITPNIDFNGTIIVPIIINDGQEDSPIFELSIEVTPVNDAPIIASATDGLTTPEETSFEIDLTQLTVTDPDNIFPSDFNLTVNSGDNYTVTENQVTPVADFVGNLTVPVFVNDGLDDSPIFEITLEVTKVTGVELNNVPDEIKVFPNPSSYDLDISFDSDFFGNLTIELSNLNGKIVKSYSFDKEEVEFRKRLDIKDFPSGLYLIKIIQNGRLETLSKVLIK